MNDDRKIWWWAGIVVVLLFLALWGAWLVQSVVLFFVVLGIIICILLASIAVPLTHWLSASSISLVYPSEHAVKPSPMYGVAEANVKRGRFQEAWNSYEAIIREYPDEVNPYIGLLDIAMVHLHDAPLAETIYQRGMTVLKKAEDRETLARMYRAIHSLLDAKSEWQQKRTISMNGHPVNPFPNNTSDQDVPSAPRLK